jgi:lincosamide and streptogramin A transport system ATP-binding/permease protein
MSINKTDINIEKGNYSTWRQNMDMVEEYEFRTRDKLEREIKQFERRSKQTRKWAGAGNTQKYAFASNARTNGCRSYMCQAKKSEENILANINSKKKLLLNYEEAKDLQITQKQIVNNECLIKAEKLSFAYPNSSIIIKDTNIKIYHGDRIWIKGKNGAGKSTLLKLLSGEIEIDKKIEYAEGIKISVSSQETLWTSGFINERFETKEKENQLEPFLSLCDMFDLPDNFLTRPLETYSSGELKKVDIARALSEKNDILFFDEPLNFMDVFFREQLEKAILEYEPTIVFVEHDSRFGRNVSNRVIEMTNNGDVISKITL